MICPVCKMKWNIGGCHLCGECPGCISFQDRLLESITGTLKKQGLTTVGGGRETSHSCGYKPVILTEEETAAKQAEGTKCTR